MTTEAIIELTHKNRKLWKESASFRAKHSWIAARFYRRMQDIDPLTNWSRFWPESWDCSWCYQLWEEDTEMRGREEAYILISRFAPVFVIYDRLAKVYRQQDLGAPPELFEALETSGLLPIPQVLLRQKVENEVSLFAYLFGRYDEYLSYPSESDRWFRTQFEEWKELIKYLEADPEVVLYEDFVRRLRVRATLETFRAECPSSALETLDTWDERFIRSTVGQSGYLEVNMPGLPPKLHERVPKRIDPGSQVFFDLVADYKNRNATGQHEP